MVIRHPNIWKWLPFTALGLVLISNFAPISDSLDRILTGVTAAIMLTFSGAYYYRQERSARRADQSNSAAISSADQSLNRAGLPGTIRRLLDWMLLPALALGLLSLKTLAPISDLLDKALSGVAVAILLVYLGVPMREYHRAVRADRSSSTAISSGDQT
jgi:hypothetical protein